MAQKISGRLSSLADTERLAQCLARELIPTVLVGLSGPLGAGKTELVRAILRALGVTGQITSPTFVLECIYEIAAPPPGLAVHHWDLYRCAAGGIPGDLRECRTAPGRLVFVEWPERCAGAEDLLDLQIMLAFGAHENERECAISGKLTPGLKKCLKQ